MALTAMAVKNAKPISDPRNPEGVTHTLTDILRTRILAITCGYEDGNDLAQSRRLSGRDQQA